MKRPKVTINTIDSQPRFCKLLIENTTILSAYWFIYWYGRTFIENIGIETTQYNKDILNKQYYIPKLNAEKEKEYRQTAKKIYITIQKSSIHPNKIFGLFPMNTMISIVAKVHIGLISYRAEKWDINTFPKRINRWEFPVSDFGYLQAAFEKAKRIFCRDNNYEIKNTGVTYNQDRKKNLKKYLK